MLVIFETNLYYNILKYKVILFLVYFTKSINFEEVLLRRNL